MSDLDLRVRELAIEMLGDILIERETDESIELLADLMRCRKCPFNKICLAMRERNANLECEDTMLYELMEKAIKEMTEEES